MYVVNYNNGRLILLKFGSDSDCLYYFCHNVAINLKVVRRYIDRHSIFEHKGIYLVTDKFLEMKFDFNISHYHSIHYTRGGEIKDFLKKKIRDIKIDNLMR